MSSDYALSSTHKEVRKYPATIWTQILPKRNVQLTEPVTDAREVSSRLRPRGRFHHGTLFLV